MEVGAGNVGGGGGLGWRWALVVGVWGGVGQWGFGVEVGSGNVEGGRGSGWRWMLAVWKLLHVASLTHSSW